MPAKKKPSPDPEKLRPGTAGVIKEGLHPRNRFRAGYDFQKLIQCHPGLAAFVVPNAYGNDSVNYADPAAVKALNQALLAQAYGLWEWDIPPGYLCPAIPGRSDYVHLLADLLAESGAAIPTGRSVAVLDIGTGANCIYPLIGASEYGWRFVGTDIDPAAVRWAGRVAAANPGVSALIECRLQTHPEQCFKGVVQAGEVFDAAMCNPPFHASAEEAEEGSRRKVRNLAGGQRKRPAGVVLNFGGQRSELWCPGGEPAFVQRMIRQSTELPRLCRWYTTLVSKSVNLPLYQHRLKEAGAVEVKTLEMAQGQKKSRILAWTFISDDERRRSAVR